MPLRLRRALSSASAVAVNVVVVIVVLVLPGRLAYESASGPTRPRPADPTLRTDAVGTRDWTALECPGHAVGCGVPDVLKLGAVQLHHRRGHQQDVRQREPGTRTLTRTVGPTQRTLWVLVGAQGASSASQLSVKVSGGAPYPIPAGTLTLLTVPRNSGRNEITVSDYGRSGGHEVLHIEEYDALASDRSGPG